VFLALTGHVAEELQVEAVRAASGRPA
jgi:hypothetical protein